MVKTMQQIIFHKEKLGLVNSTLEEQKIYELKAGDVLTKDNVRAIRPGLGLPTKYLDVVLNKTLNRDVVKGTALSWDLIDQFFLRGSDE